MSLISIFICKIYMLLSKPCYATKKKLNKMWFVRNEMKKMWFVRNDFGHACKLVNFAWQSRE